MQKHKKIFNNFLLQNESKKWQKNYKTIKK